MDWSSSKVIHKVFLLKFYNQAKFYTHYCQSLVYAETQIFKLRALEWTSCALSFLYTGALQHEISWDIW